MLAPLLAVAALAAAAAGLSFARPSWWDMPDPSAGAVAGAAEQLENAIVSQLSLARPDDLVLPGYQSQPWTVSMSQEDANAWLAARLVAWAASRGIRLPAGIDAAQVEFSDGLVRLAARQASGESHRYLVGAVRPQVRSDGQLWLAADRLGVGGLLAPAPVACTLAALWLPDTADVDLAEVLRARQPAAEPLIELADRRRVRLLDIVVRDGRLELTCRTEAGR